MTTYIIRQTMRVRRKEAMNALPVVKPLCCNAFGGGRPCLKNKNNEGKCNASRCR